MGIELAKCFVTVSATTSEATAALRDVTKATDDLARSGSYLAQIEREEAAARSRAVSVTENVATATERRSAKQAELNNLLDRGMISEATYNRTLRRLSTEGLQEMSARMSEIGGTAAIMGGMVTYAFGASAKSAIMAAGAYEQTMIAFSTMMGSAEKATGLLNDLTKFAAETPFEMPEIEQVARGMVMFGEDSKSLMDTLQMLGNAASGTSSSFGMLGLVYNQIRGVGKLLTQDFRQLSTRGVISLRDIAKHYKITDAAAQEMLSRGKVSFEDFRAIMMNLAGENGTGRFAGMMKKQSESMMGLLSTFSDAWRITMRQIGEEIVPVGKWFVKLGITAVSSFSSMDSVTKKLIAGTLGLGAALGGVFTTMASGAFLTGKLISVYSQTTEILARYAETSRMAAAAQGSLNVAWAATPYLLGAMAAAAALVIGYKLGQWMVDQTEKAKKFNEVLAEQRDQFEFEKGVGVDFTGSSEQDVKNFIDATESGIARAETSLKSMESKWFANKDAIALTKDQIALMKDQIEKAQEKLLEFAVSGGLPSVDKQIEDVDANLKRLNTEIEGTMQRMDELRAPPKNAMVYDVAEERRRRENLAMYEEKLAKMRAEQDNDSRRSVELRRQREKIVAEVDDKATEKIKEKTEALKTENETYGMSAVAAEAYKMKVDKVADAQIKAYVAEQERANGLKALQQQQEAMNKAQEEYVKHLQAELSQPALLPSQIPDPMGDLGNMMPDMLADFDELGQILEEIKTPAERLDDAFAQLKWQFDDGLLSQENYMKALAAMGRSLTDSVMTPSEKTTKQLAEWKQMLDNGAISQETYNRLVRDMGRSITKAVWDAKAAIDSLSGTMGFADLGNRIQDMLMKEGPASGIVGPVGMQPAFTGDHFAGIGEPVPADMNEPIPMTTTESIKFQNAMAGAADWLAEQQQLKFQDAMAGAADWMIQEQSKQEIADFGKVEKLLSDSNKGQRELIAAVKNPPKQPMVLQ